MIVRKIIKVGSSFAVTVPVEILKYINVGPKDYVSLTVTDNRKVLIEKIGKEEPSKEMRKGYESEKEIFVPGSGWVPKY